MVNNAVFNAAAAVVTELCEVVIAVKAAVIAAHCALQSPLAPAWYQLVDSIDAIAFVADIEADIAFAAPVTAAEPVIVAAADADADAELAAGSAVANDGAIFPPGA